MLAVEEKDMDRNGTKVEHMTQAVTTTVIKVDTTIISSQDMLELTKYGK